MNLYCFNVDIHRKTGTTFEESNSDSKLFLPTEQAHGGGGVWHGNQIWLGLLDSVKVESVNTDMWIAAVEMEKK